MSTPGYSGKRRRGALIIPSPYVRVPYRLLTNDSYLALDELAIKIFWILVSEWRTNEPDEPVQMSFDIIREKCSKRVNEKIVKPSFGRISKAIKQLMLDGFVEKDVKHRAINKYWINQCWFTGEHDE